MMMVINGHDEKVINESFQMWKIKLLCPVGISVLKHFRLYFSLRRNFSIILNHRIDSENVKNKIKKTPCTVYNYTYNYILYTYLHNIYKLYPSDTSLCWTIFFYYYYFILFCMPDEVFAVNHEPCIVYDYWLLWVY